MDTRIIDLNRDIVKSSLDSLIRVFSKETDILFKNTPQQYPLYKDLSDFCKIYFEFYENNRQIIKDIGEEEDDNYIIEESFMEDSKSKIKRSFEDSKSKIKSET